MDTTDSVGKERSNREDCGFRILAVIGDGVGEDDLGQRTVENALGGGVAHDGVAAEGAHALGAVLHHEVGGFGDCAGCVDHVVDEDYVLVLDVADDGHLLDNVGFGALFVAENKRYVEIFGVGVRTLCAADVGSGDDEVGEVEVLDVGDEDVRGVEVVYWNIEEALDLVGVEIHGDEAVDSGHAQKVGDEFGGDRNARFVFAVLTGPSEIGHYGDDGAGAGAAGCVDHQKKLHEVVGVGEGRLDEIDVAAADRFFERYFEFAVGEVLDVHLAEFYAEVLADFLGHIL